MNVGNYSYINNFVYLGSPIVITASIHFSISQIKSNYAIFVYHIYNGIKSVNSHRLFTYISYMTDILIIANPLSHRTLRV